MIYNNVSPAQSTTSLSDAEDDFNKSTFFHTDPVPATPAQWSCRSPHCSHPQPPLPSYASSLPPEILIHILRYLHSSRDLYHSLLVSRTWCECAVELLWHRPSFTKLPTLGKMMRVLARDDQTFSYARFIRRLNFLYLGGELSDSLFSRLAQCVRLERLTLINCSALSDSVLARVLPCCPNLVALDLTGVVETTDKAIVALASSAKKLQGINLGGCKKLTDKAILALAANCPLLRRVKLSHVENVTDESVSALAQSCPLLLEIDLNNCKKITDTSVRDLWAHSCHMREMRLSHCVELTDSAFPASPRTDIVLSGPNPFPSSNPFNPDRAPSLKISKQFEHLRMLDLTGCSNITDEAVEGIIAIAPKIRNLVLAKCMHLTDAAVEAICMLGKHLHYLHLGHAVTITDRSIRTLARACTRLRYIDLANCVQLTDMSVFELSGLQKLRRIGLVRVHNLTDHAIYSLAERHATLERIHLSYCDQITVRAIHFLLQKLPKLTHLSLTGVPDFRRPELQKFCRDAPAEFNSQQRAAFCVYSGKGVSELREFLVDSYNALTDDMANGSGTEDDDEDDGQSFGEEPDSVIETDQTDEMFGHRHGRIPQTNGAVSQPRPPEIVTIDPTQSGIQFPPRELLMSRERANRPVSRGSPAQRGMLDSPATVIAGPSRVTRGFGHQPLIETSTSPAPSDAVSNRSGGTNHSTGTAFFRHYNEANPTLRQGVMTPDLIFAEIGHGRGAGPPHAGPSTIVIPAPTRRTVDPLVIVPPSPSGSLGPSAYTPMASAAIAATGMSSSHRMESARHPPSSSGVSRDSGGSELFERSPVLADSSNSYHNGDAHSSWASIPPDSVGTPSASSSPTAREMQHPNVHSVLGQPGTVFVEEGRGRSVKRSLRSTFSTAEQYASSFFFGRGQGPNEGGSESSGGAHMRDGDIRGH